MKKQSIIRLIATSIVAVMILTMLVSCKGKDGAQGKDGVTPTIEISEDGYWVINGTKTDVKASSEDFVDENPQGLQFFLQDDGTYIVSCGDAKYLGKIIIPATYKGGAVVGIDKYAFEDCTNLTSVVIPDSVTSIGYSSFLGCSSLTSVVIPDSVTSIGDAVFWDCSSLISVVIPDSVTSIGGLAFENCSSLTSIVIPDSVTSIGSSAFSGCSSLTSVIIPDSVTSIGDYAFENCSSLSSVIIGDSVTSIGDFAFDGCSSQNDVYYTGSEEEWKLISIGNGNAYLKNATIHYNYVPEN